MDFEEASIATFDEDVRFFPNIFETSLLCMYKQCPSIYLTIIILKGIKENCLKSWRRNKLLWLSIFENKNYVW